MVEIRDTPNDGAQQPGNPFVPSVGEAFETAMDLGDVSEVNRPALARSIMALGLKKAVERDPTRVDLQRTVEVPYLGQVCLLDLL